MKSLCLLLLFVLCAQSSDQITPITDCPEYVPEDKNLSCQCLSPSNLTEAANLTWPDNSDTAYLLVDNVQREKNGSQFTCQLETDGFNSSIQYTLRVAYGPSDENVRIQMVHTKNPANEMPMFQLTCLAMGVYPVPHYSWSDITCDNGNAGDTCTFTPGPDENSVQPTCFAESRIAGVNIAQSDSALFWLSRPPRANTTKTMRTAVGKSISCLVKSYPAPDNFTFIHLHHETSTDGSTVSSSWFSASCTQDNAEQLMVMCFITPRDIPEQRLGYYRVVISNDFGSVEVMLLIDPEAKPKKINFGGLTFGALTFLGVMVLVVIAVVVIVMLLKKRRPANRSNRHRRQPYCNSEALTAPPAPHTWRRRRSGFQADRSSFGSERTHSYVDIPDDDTTIISRSIASIGSSFGSDSTVFYGHRTHTSVSSSMSSNESESYCHAYGFSRLDNGVQGNNKASVATSNDPAYYLHPIPSRLEAAAPPWTTRTQWTSGGKMIVPEMTQAACCSSSEAGPSGTSTDPETGITTVRSTDCRHQPNLSLNPKESNSEAGLAPCSMPAGDTSADPETTSVQQTAHVLQTTHAEIEPHVPGGLATATHTPPESTNTCPAIDKPSQATEAPPHGSDTSDQRRQVAAVFTMYTGEFGAAFHTSSQPKPDHNNAHYK